MVSPAAVSDRQYQGSGSNDMVDVEVWFVPVCSGNDRLCARTWAAPWPSWRWFKVGRRPANLQCPFGLGWSTSECNCLTTRLQDADWKHHFMSGVRTIVLSFIGQTRQRRTCVITLLNLLSTSCCVVLHCLFSTTRMKILVLVVSDQT